MVITNVFARERFNSKGLPTIVCSVILDNSIEFLASVPSGTSKSSYECVSLYDNEKRFFGKGVTNAIEKINTIINVALKNKKPDVVTCDQILLALDGTENKSVLGANSIIAVSMAIARAQAYLYNIELYELFTHINQNEQIGLPMPLVNMINGGMHGNKKLMVQEFLVMPQHADSFADGFRQGVEIFYALGALLEKKKIFHAIGDEGGYAINIDTEEQALDLLYEAIENTIGIDNVQIALDCAASHWYDRVNKLYTFHDKRLVTEEVIDWYKTICKKYPIILLEDPLSEHDIDGWKLIYQQIKDVYMIGDDVFATSPERIWQLIQKDIAHGAIIKPDQIGTVTQTLQAIQVCQENDMLYIPSHRSGETNDSYIVDLAVGNGARLIKIGGVTRGERIEKYNRLLTIEENIYSL